MQEYWIISLAKNWTNEHIDTDSEVGDFNLQFELEEKQALEFRILPNPTNGLLEINWMVEDPKKNIQLSLLNNFGEIVLEQTITKSLQKFDWQYLPNGIYYVQIKSATQTEIKKFVKLQ